MAGKFEVYENRSGQWEFQLKAANGLTVASGEVYATKAAAKRACESVKKAADGAEVAARDRPPAAVRQFRSAGMISASHDLSARIDGALSGDTRTS